MNVITNKLNTSLPSLLGKARVWGFFLFLLFSLPISAKTWTADQVKELITRVNTYWQQNNKAETRSFWDPAAYHTGNMEVYKLLKDDKQLDYTRRWAYHNNWSGATEADPSRWKYANYGEGKDYVLFGDWQVCFQTYIDLYNLAIANGGTDADNYFMVKRAKEVMHYEAYSKKDDYWWWSDALYMVMPVMTKMYKLTGDVQYLDKLYENLLYSDRIMLDQETGLYFRDARYVYPNHKSVNGKMHSWDGVMVGCLQVLLRFYRICQKTISTTSSLLTSSSVLLISLQRHNRRMVIGLVQYLTPTTLQDQRQAVQLSLHMALCGV